MSTHTYIGAVKDNTGEGAEDARLACSGHSCSSPRAVTSRHMLWNALKGRVEHRPN
jgi:hypothetical protein